MNHTTITIGIVDDHTLFRKGVASLLSEFSEIELVFEAANGIEMKNIIASRAAPQVVLMDITMPQMDGFESTRWLKQHYPQTKVLALSMLESDKPIIAMMKSGAVGYLLKESKPAGLVTAIRMAAEQGYYLNELVSGRLLRSLQDNPAGGPEPATLLSANEIKFLEWCCTELTYKEIAARMQLSTHTIDNYRESLFNKLDLKSRTGLVLFALRNHIVRLQP